jgi:hypothetical protein
MSHLHLPHPERLSSSTQTMREAFWVAVLGLVSLFAFFLVIGAVTPAQAGVATGVVAAMAVAYAWHAWHAARTVDARDPRVIQARERRGF